MPFIFELFGIFSIGVMIYIIIHRSKYNKLMSHLQQHHPEIYEQTRIKPILGPFYGVGAYQTSMNYAKNHTLLDDPIAEELLADYAEFSHKRLWVFGIGVAIFFVLPFIWRFVLPLFLE
jgi:hypothetical protein